MFFYKMRIIVAVTIQILNTCVASKMEGFIVGGDYTPINKHPYSAALTISCLENGQLSTWTCGSSIINQRILLTAGHCLEDCGTKLVGRSRIMISVGNENKNQASYSGSHFKVHERYNSVTVANDIALILVSKSKPLALGQKISRVVLMSDPPYSEDAYVAGWGLIDEKLGKTTQWLKRLKQKVMKKSRCNEILQGVPRGTICAGHFHSSEYASEGDSGSALVVRNVIQIGIVSYKDPGVTRGIVVYTDVGYFYTWIMSTAKALYCEHSK